MQVTDAEEMPVCNRTASAAVAATVVAGVAVPGGCKPGSTPSDVVGDALVIEDGTPASSKAMKATADCLIEGFNTYQYGGRVWDWVWLGCGRRTV